LLRCDEGPASWVWPATMLTGGKTAEAGRRTAASLWHGGRQLAESQIGS